MKNYTFIKQNDNFNDVYPTPIYAISRDIEEMRVSDTYTHYGMPVDPGTAGDYIELLTQNAVDIANKAYQEDEDEKEKFSLNDIVSDYDYGNVFSAVVSEADDQDYGYEATMCSGFNYFDGSNWQSIIVTHENDSTEWDIVEDDTLEDKIDSKEWIKDGFGTKVYESENYWIVNNYCQGSFASYELYSKEEYDLEDI